MRNLAKALCLLTAALVVLSRPAQAQSEKQEPKGELVSKVFQLKHGDVNRIVSALNPLLGYGDSVRANTELKMVVVRTYKELMSAVEEVVRRLDVPIPAPVNVELTVYLLQASQQPAPDSAAPSELQPTIKQLKGAFAYQGFRVLDTLIVRSRAGQVAETTGVLSFGKDETGDYQFSCQPSLVSEDNTRLIRLDKLRLGARIPFNLPGGGRSSRQVVINVDVDVREGQKVVVGKTGLEGPEKALILVVSGKVVE